MGSDDGGWREHGLPVGDPIQVEGISGDGLGQNRQGASGIGGIGIIDPDPIIIVKSILIDRALVGTGAEGRPPVADSFPADGKQG